MFDASNIKRVYKGLLCLVCFAFWAQITVTYVFFALKWEVSLYGDVTYAMTPLITDASKIWCIFTLKQGIMTFVRDKKCILIKYTPYMKHINK
mmetsp:Transcript_11789/g.14792  ORF Transcript_11789/g.14792 Transcript_11789/m.14792 type:complete len:93 (-) Transcript_11789:9-287(-)